MYTIDYYSSVFFMPFPCFHVSFCLSYSLETSWLSTQVSRSTFSSSNCFQTCLKLHCAALRNWVHCQSTASWSALSSICAFCQPCSQTYKHHLVSESICLPDGVIVARLTVLTPAGTDRGNIVYTPIHHLEALYIFLRRISSAASLSLTSRTAFANWRLFPLVSLSDHS